MHIDPARLRSAYEKVCNTLLARRNADGYWTGTLSASSLSTAVAVSAFSVFLKKVKSGGGHHLTPEELQQLESLIPQSTDWLLAHQNPDGGWGDTDKSLSNVSTTVLVQSALTLSVDGRRQTADGSRVGDFVAEETIPTPPEVGNNSPPSEGCPKGGVVELPDTSALTLASAAVCRLPSAVSTIKTRYGSDQTFAVPILTNAALAGLVDWKEVPQLPFELAALPMAWFRFVKLNVVSYAVPALVAVGQVRFHHAPAKGQPIRNFCCNFFRHLAKKRTLRLIEKMQPESGGYLEAAPLTAFVAMSLSAMGLTDHPIVTKGLRFLLATVRADGSWPIDTNLATWLTSLSLSALQDFDIPDKERTLDWLVSCQHRRRHPFTGAQPGGWGWTNLTGSVPDADDTAGALLALASYYNVPSPARGGSNNVPSPPGGRVRVGAELVNASSPHPSPPPKGGGDEKNPPLEGEVTLSEGEGTLESVIAGMRWLLNLQNRDGGMPTFCRGWGMLPFDQSSTDITAHALRALKVWKEARDERRGTRNESRGLCPRTQNRVAKMLAFLKRSQQPDGSWFPLWFGNQFMPDDANPFYGTAKVLLALAEVDPENNMIPKGLQYLITHQNPDGGWGSKESSVEETAVVVETLAALERRQTADGRRQQTQAYEKGLNWLLEAVESDRFLEPSPIGLYFAKLWYYEELYPIIFTASALRRAFI